MSISANAPGDPGREQGDSGDPNREPVDDILAGADGEAGSADADDATAADSTETDSTGSDSSGTDSSGAAGAGAAATSRRKGGDAGKDVTKKVKQEARASAAAVKGKAGPKKKSGSSATRTDEPGFFGRIVLFIRQVFAEIRKVVTPTRQELVTFSVVVIVFILAMMAYVGVLDFGIGRLVLWVFGN